MFCMNHQQNKKPRYTEKSKQQIINLYLSGTPATTLAKKYGLNRQTIYRWQKRYAPSININKPKTISLKDYEELQKKIQKKISQLKLEDEILKKSYQDIHKNTTNEIVTFINKYQNQSSIQLMCKLLHISRTTDYNTTNQLGYNKKRYTKKISKDYLKT